jgi:hypothetical protein
MTTELSPARKTLDIPCPLPLPRPAYRVAGSDDPRGWIGRFDSGRAIADGGRLFGPDRLDKEDQMRQVVHSVSSTPVHAFDYMVKVVRFVELAMRMAGVTANCQPLERAGRMPATDATPPAGRDAPGGLMCRSLKGPPQPRDQYAELARLGLLPSGDPTDERTPRFM